MEELKPCPFCGSSRVEVVGHFPFVRCKECEAETDNYDDKEAAAEAWNTRAERTCHPFVSPDGAGWYAIGCSNCGHGFADNNPDKAYLLRISKRSDIMPRYCSGCGAKVIHDANV